MLGQEANAQLEISLQQPFLVLYSPGQVQQKGQRDRRRWLCMEVQSQ